MQIFVITLVAFAISAWLTMRFSMPGSRLYILDHPNERSLHKAPTPRSGGVAVIAGIVSGLASVAWLFAIPDDLVWLLAALLLLALVSYFDDRHTLKVTDRLLTHLICAAMLLYGGLSLPELDLPGIAWKWPPWLGIGVLLLFIIWMINLYNFMDGMDGFAGGMAVIGFGAYAIFGWIGGQPLFFIVSLVICAAAAGFLISNFPPAKIFLGDAGSASLGLLAAGLSLWGARDGLFPLWVALLIFSPFIADATVTLLRRLLKGEKVWEAHRSHCYQRLVQAGWGHRKTLLWEYSLMLACAATGLLVTHRSAETQLFALALWTGIYLFLFRAVKWAEHRSLGAK